MFHRRLILAGLLSAVAAPALAQGKKGSGSASGSTNSIAGSYTALGSNPDGTTYEGRCEITQQGHAVEFTWHIGDGTNSGSGIVEGRIVTVDWGDAHPVIYVIMPDGELHGTWADGAAFEKLTPM